MSLFFKRFCRFVMVVLGFVAVQAVHAQDWFEVFKDRATPAQLHQFLYVMPKGGDLHLHITGSVLSEWMYAIALEQSANGYRYYSKHKIENCPSGLVSGRATPYLMLYQTVDQVVFDALDACEQQEYVALDEFTPVQIERWQNGLRLDKPYEGRDEFFSKHWERMGDLARNPHVVGEFLVRNMQAFAAEGLIYMEPQVPIFGFRQADGQTLTPDEVMAVYLDRLAEKDAQDTGMTLRMQVSLLRFLPNAEEVLAYLYKFAHAYEQVVAVNFVGREDNDKGYPLRFLETLRELRKTYSGVQLSIHAGEVDEPNYHVRDTLLLGADRIGHGVNLITDPETLIDMRYGPYLVEINLISNLLLEYVSQYSQHPFPEYLRTGVPVALSTDDRGMWDSTMTDEFFVAVTEFDLSWREVLTLSRNSLRYSFLDDDEKQRVLALYNKRIERFEKDFQRKGDKVFADAQPPRLGFVCRQYELCEN